MNDRQRQPADVVPFPEASAEDKLAVRTQELGSAMLGPRTIGQALEWARILFGSALVPKSYQTPADVLVAMLFGGELGLSAVQSLQNIAIVNGKASVYGDAPLGIIYARTGDGGTHAGQLETFNETWDPNLDGGTWTTTIKRLGRDEIVRTFSVGDAKKIPYSEWNNDPGAARGEKKHTTLDQKDTYKAYPRRMCKFKARHEACRDAFPDLLLGIIPTEEAEEIRFRPGIDLDGEVTARDGIKLETLEDLIGRLEVETAKSVQAGFDALNYSRAERLVRLREFRGRDAALIDWLKDEYAKIKTRGLGRVKTIAGHPSLGAEPASLPAPAVAADVSVADTPAAAERADGERPAASSSATNKAASAVLF